MSAELNAPAPLSQGQRSKEHLYKLIVIGEFGVGKTSIIRRYTEDYFSPNYKLTIGVDFALKTIEWDLNTRVNLQLWDIAGHERFGHMTRVYYKYAVAAIIVFDLSRESTFDAVSKWLEDVRSKVLLQSNEPVPVLLFANKCDLPNVKIDTESLNAYCRENNLLAWFPTSAKEDINIGEGIQYLVQHILSLDSSHTPTPEPMPRNNSLVFTDDDDTQHYQTGTGCCSS